MSGASEAASKVKACAHETYRLVFEAGAQLGRQHTEVHRSVDLVEVLQASIDQLVAIEQLLENAETAAKQLRWVIGTTMMETGATHLAATHHTAHLARKPAFLNIADPATVPDEYWTTPEPHIQQSKLRAAIKAGAAIEGVSIVTPNEQTLVVRAKQEKAT